MQLARLSAIALAVPESHWHRAISTLDRLKTRTAQASIRALNTETVKKIDQALGQTSNQQTKDWMSNEIRYRNAEDILSILKDRTKNKWRPTLQVAGREHVSRALKSGKGAVLWIAAQRNRLAWKKGLHGAGINVIHLSRNEHGFSSSEFAIKHLNPICTDVECRYLKSRATFEPEAELAVIRYLRRMLENNEVVSIQDLGRSAKPIEVPFLNGFRSFHTGAPSIAYSAGSALLPVFTERTGNQAFKVTIGPPIASPPGTSRSEAVRNMTERFAELLATYMSACPEQWNWDAWSAESKLQSRNS
jgi:lauroyl/myristoyl acyltransferase